MTKPDGSEPQQALVNPPARDRGGRMPPFPDRRRKPRPPLAEIRRGGKLNLLPPVMVSGAVRTAEFLIVAVLGFAPKRQRRIPATRSHPRPPAFRRAPRSRPGHALKAPASSTPPRPRQRLAQLG